jgi:predicted nucleic acid-binding Zn ribbon protein
MAELLRDNPVIVAGLVMLVVVMVALRMRLRQSRQNRGDHDNNPTGRRRPPQLRHDEDQGEASGPAPEVIERARRRARWQMIMALFAILGFTLIAIINSF